MARDRNAEVEALYRQHGAALLLFAAAICGDHGRAQDALHQVFLKMMESGTLHEAKDKKAYLFASVRNAVLNDARQRDRTVAIDADTAWFIPPERDYAEERGLRHALNLLSDDQREIVALHIWGELTFAAIGELLGINANTVASRYRYALAKLRETMRPMEGLCAT